MKKYRNKKTGEIVEVLRAKDTKYESMRNTLIDTQLNKWVYYSDFQLKRRYEEVKNDR